jgi:hypothetical protein
MYPLSHMIRVIADSLTVAGMPPSSVRLRAK